MYKWIFLTTNLWEIFNLTNFTCNFFHPTNIAEETVFKVSHLKMYSIEEDLMFFEDSFGHNQIYYKLNRTIKFNLVDIFLWTFLPMHTCFFIFFYSIYLNLFMALWSLSIFKKKIFITHTFSNIYFGKIIIITMPIYFLIANIKYIMCQQKEEKKWLKNIISLKPQTIWIFIVLKFIGW